MMFLRGSCVFPRALCKLRRRGAVIRGDAHTVKTFLPGWCLRWEGKGPFQAAMSGPSPVQPRQVWGPPERPCLARWCTCEWTGAPPPLRVFFLASGAPDPTTLTVAPGPITDPGNGSLVGPHMSTATNASATFPRRHRGGPCRICWRRRGAAAGDPLVALASFPTPPISI